MSTWHFYVILAAVLLCGAPLFCGVAVLVIGCMLLYGSSLDDLNDIFGPVKDMVVKEELLAIPFFILAGALITRGQIAQRLIDFARATIGWAPGGLAISTVLACMFFAAISGSSPVTVIAIGTIMYPALTREQYRDQFSVGLITSAGSLGILIPPSIPMIVFAILIGSNVQKLFIGGILPGLLLGGLLAVYCVVANLGSDTKRIPFSIKHLLVASWRGKWAIALPFLILGGIYGVASSLPEEDFTRDYRQLVEHTKNLGNFQKDLPVFEEEILSAGGRHLTDLSYHGQKGQFLDQALTDFRDQALRTMAVDFGLDRKLGVPTETLMARLQTPAFQDLLAAPPLEGWAEAVYRRREGAAAALLEAETAEAAEAALRKLGRYDYYYRLERLRQLAAEHGVEPLAKAVERLSQELAARALDLAVGGGSVLGSSVSPSSGLGSQLAVGAAISVDEPWWVVSKETRASLTMTPTQAAVVSVVYALVVEFAIPYLFLILWWILPRFLRWKRGKLLSLAELPRLCIDSAKLIGILFMILVLAFSFNQFLTLEQIPDKAAMWLEDSIDSQIGFLLLVNLFLLAVGCLMDIMSAILILAPLLWPIAERFGMDPTHFGILFIVNLEIGYLTPPMGINLFVSASLFNKPLGTVIKGTLPFMLILLLGLVLIVAIPPISTALIGGGRARGPDDFRLSHQVIRVGEELELSWSSEPDVSSYEVEVSLDSQFSEDANTKTVYSRGLDLECVWRAEKPGTYYFRIRSINEDGLSLWILPNLLRVEDSAGQEHWSPLRTASGLPQGLQVLGEHD